MALKVLENHLKESEFMEYKKDKNKKRKLSAAGQIKAKEKLEKRRAESEVARIRAEKENKKREEYAKSLNEDRLALIKSKQGLADVEIAKDEEVIEKKLTFKEKLASFIYLNKWWLGIVTCCAVVLGIVAFDLLSKENADLTVLLLTDEMGFYSNSENISKLFGEYVGDVNGDGEVVVNIHYMPIGGGDSDSAELQADPYMLNVHKLDSELKIGNAVIIIADSQADEYLDPKNTLLNLSELFPENEHINEYGFYLKDTDFTERVAEEMELSDEVYIGIRQFKEGLPNEKKLKKNIDKAYPALEKLINGIS